MQPKDSDSNKPIIYHHIKGVVCLIGHGSIGKGFVPLLKKHFTYEKFVVIDPIDVPP